MYYLGIDGGGTNSRLAVSGKDGQMIGRYEGASTNLASNSGEIVKQNIEKLTGLFFQEHKVTCQDCSGVCIGSAGIDTQGFAEQMMRIFGELGFTCPVLAVNDSEIILWAEMKDEAGIVLISGTGSISYGKNQEGTVRRCGGWGHLFDDKGSGYWIGKEVVARAFMSYDRRAKHTILEETLRKHFGVSEFPDILHIVYDADFRKQDMAALAFLACEGVAKGDTVCIQIMEEAAEQLLCMIGTLMDRLHLSGDCKIILSGGSLVQNAYLKEKFMSGAKKRWPELQIYAAEQEPVLGALYLARKRGGSKE